jgi:plastocyanin
MRSHVLLVSVAVLAVPAIASAQSAPDQPAAASAFVDFGVLPLGPIGAAPCLQAGAIGGPADPCAYTLHVLEPEEVTVLKGGEVTFQVHGGGHGFAIYEVSKNTTRDEIGQFLCAGADPSTLADPNSHVCNLSATNANAQHVIPDGKGDVVIVAATGTTGHPNNRVWSPEGRLVSAGAHRFLDGGTVPAGAASNGQLITYQFLKTGRYLVICMNRVHFLNDWMFGFVNVTGE